MSRRHPEGWDTALDAQLMLMHSFNTTEGREYLNGFSRSLGAAGMYDSRTGELEEGNREYADMVIGHATQNLTDCDPIYVSGDLTELIDYAAESFQPEALLVTDLLVPSGFAYFGKPLYVTDRRELKMPFRAIQWNPTIDTDQGEGVAVATKDQPQTIYSGVVITLYAHRADGDPMDDPTGPHYSERKIGGSDLAMEYITTLRFGQKSTVYETDDSIRDMLAHVKVFFRLCQQTIAVPRHERVSRPTWKRARASWKDIKEVVVFTLRRAKPPKYEGEEREVEWTHRWVVQGHWRNQPYPSEGVHRQIWIAPYIKGPDGKPLVFKRRAFELVR